METIAGFQSARRTVPAPTGRWAPNAWMEGEGLPRVPIAVREISLNEVVFETTIPLTVGGSIFLSAATQTSRVSVECIATSQTWMDSEEGDRRYRCEARIVELDPHRLQRFADQF